MQTSSISNNFLSDSILNVGVEYLDIPKWCHDYTETPDGKEIQIISYGYLQKDTTAVRTIRVVGPQGDTSEYHKCPITDRKKSFALHITPGYTTSPDGSKFVLSAGAGAIIETFDISKGIKNITTSYFIEPKIIVDGGGYSYEDSHIFGFGRPFATNDKIYFPYDGETSARQRKESPNGAKPLLFKNIAVFDWKGSPLTIYRTEYRVEYICIDKNDDTSLYAILMDRDGRYFIGRA